MLQLSSLFFPLLFPFLSLFLFYNPFLSSIGRPSLLLSGGDNQLLTLADEKGRRKVQRHRGGLQHGKKKRINEMKNKLFKVERDKKSAEVALDNAERQAEGQWVLLCQAKD